MSKDEAAAALPEVRIVSYDKLVQDTQDEQLKPITGLIDKDLSEPYSVYTYRFFLHNWPTLTFLVRGPGRVFGCCSRLTLSLPGIRRGQLRWCCH